MKLGEKLFQRRGNRTQKGEHQNDGRVVEYEYDLSDESWDQRDDNFDFEDMDQPFFSTSSASSDSQGSGTFIYSVHLGEQREGNRDDEEEEDEDDDEEEELLVVSSKNQTHHEAHRLDGTALAEWRDEKPEVPSYSADETRDEQEHLPEALEMTRSKLDDRPPTPHAFSTARLDLLLEKDNSLLDEEPATKITADTTTKDSWWVTWGRSSKPASNPTNNRIQMLETVLPKDDIDDDDEASMGVVTKAEAEVTNGSWCGVTEAFQRVSDTIAAAWPKPAQSWPTSKPLPTVDDELASASTSSSLDSSHTTTSWSSAEHMQSSSVRRHRRHGSSSRRRHRRQSSSSRRSVKNPPEPGSVSSLTRERTMVVPVSQMVKPTPAAQKSNNKVDMVLSSLRQRLSKTFSDDNNDSFAVMENTKLSQRDPVLPSQKLQHNHDSRDDRRRRHHHQHRPKRFSHSQSSKLSTPTPPCDDLSYNSSHASRVSHAKQANTFLGQALRRSFNRKRRW